MGGGYGMGSEMGSGYGGTMGESTGMEYGSEMGGYAQPPDMGGYASPYGSAYGMGYGMGGAQNIKDRTTVASTSQHDVPVEIYGIIYIYNPVDGEKLGLDQQPTLTGTPVPATPAAS